MTRAKPDDGSSKFGAVRVTFDVFPTGWPDLLPAFFATVAARLELDGAGSRFPALTELSAGQLAPARAAALRKELEVISGELGDLSVEDVVWDDPDPAWLHGGRFTTWPRG